MLVTPTVYLLILMWALRYPQKRWVDRKRVKRVLNVVLRRRGKITYLGRRKGFPEGSGLRRNYID